MPALQIYRAKKNEMGSFLYQLYMYIDMNHMTCVLIWILSIFSFTYFYQKNNRNSQKIAWIMWALKATHPKVYCRWFSDEVLKGLLNDFIFEFTSLGNDYDDDDDDDDHGLLKWSNTSHISCKRVLVTRLIYLASYWLSCWCKVFDF